VHTSFWALGSSISNFWSKLPVSGSIGAVTSGAAVCSKIGLDAIKEGGNAADAVHSQSLQPHFCTNVGGRR
jgi:gamma-glutamyltranspeptidase